MCEVKDLKIDEIKPRKIAINNGELIVLNNDFLPLICSFQAKINSILMNDSVKFSLGAKVAVDFYEYIIDGVTLFYQYFNIKNNIILQQNILKKPHINSIPSDKSEISEVEKSTPGEETLNLPNPRVDTDIKPDNKLSKGNALRINDSADPNDKKIPESCPKIPSLIWSNNSASIIITGPGVGMEGEVHITSRTNQRTWFLQYEEVSKFTQFINQKNQIAWFNTYTGTIPSDKPHISHVIKFNETAFYGNTQLLKKNLGNELHSVKNYLINVINSTLKYAYDCCNYIDQNKHVVIESSNGIGDSVMISSMAKLLFDQSYTSFDGFLNLIYTDWINNGLFYENIDHNRVLFYSWLMCVKALQYTFLDSFQFSPSLIDYIMKHIWSDSYFPFSASPEIGSLLAVIESSKNNFVIPYHKNSNSVFNLIKNNYKFDHNEDNISRFVSPIETLYSCFPNIDKHFKENWTLDSKYLFFVELFHYDPDSSNDSETTQNDE